MSSGSYSIREYTAGEIRAHMGRQRKTGRDLASVLNISQQGASRRMLGEVDLTLDEVSAVAEWLGIQITDLLPMQKQAATA